MDNLLKCKECGADFDKIKSIHGHFRAHSLSIENYYHKHYPRFDLCSKELLVFKDIDSYFNFDFNNRANLVNWLLNSDKAESLKYFNKIILLKKEKKNIVNTPCQVELRSWQDTPSIILFNKFCSDGYYKYMESFGFKSRLKDTPHIPNHCKSIDEANVQIDTREQLPIEFGNMNRIVKKLDFGDYRLYNDNNYSVYFERKSVSDFIGTLSHGLNRFKNEIKLAKDNGAYLIILVEESLNNCLNFKSLSSTFDKIKITPQYIFHNVRELIQENDNIQFLFVNNRNEMSRVMNRIYLSAGRYKEVDLQLLYDLKGI